MSKRKNFAKAILEAHGREERDVARILALKDAAWWQLYYGPNDAMYFWNGEGDPPGGHWNTEDSEDPGEGYVPATWEWTTDQLRKELDDLPRTVWVEEDSDFVCKTEPESTWCEYDEDFDGPWTGEGDPPGHWEDPPPYYKIDVLREILGDAVHGNM